MNLKHLFFGALAAIGLSATANAAYVPATWTDAYDVGTGVYIGSGDKYEYFHDITFDGFNVGQDLVTSFYVTIDLFDDDKKDSIEIGTIDIPGLLGDRLVYNFGVKTFTGSILGLLELNAYGTLSVTISSLIGDFVFGGSTLVANGLAYTSGTVTPPSTEVPEPATLGIFGLGLLGVAFAARRRRAK
jgi:hypothetical protein